MRRLGPIDRALIFTLVPIWAFWFALYLDNLAHGRVAELPLDVSVPERPPNDYPTLIGFWDGVPREGPWQGLKVGDRLLKVGQAELRGVWPIGVQARVYKETDASLHLPITFMRADRRYQTVVSLKTHPFPWVPAIINVFFVGFAILLILRKPNSRLIQAIFVMTILLAYFFIPFGLGLGARTAPFSLTYVMDGFDFVCKFLVLPLALRPRHLFSGDAVPPKAHLPKWPWLFGIAGPLWCAWMLGMMPPPLLYAGLDIAFLVAYLGTGTYRYVHDDPVSRRQVKWVLFGVYLALVPIFTAEVTALVYPSVVPLLELTRLLYVIIPVCGFIAIVRFNLFDIDHLIGATAAYTIVSVVLIAAAIIVLPRVSQAATAAWGIDPTAGQFLVALLLAGAVVPASRFTRPQIERFFFAERYELERGVEHLLRAISSCSSPQEVLELVGERLDFYLHPESCVIYGRSAEAFAPLFFRGRTVAPVLSARATLVTALQSESRSVEVERWRRHPSVSLSRADGAVLDSLGAAVLAPMHRGDMIAALLCLGQKRSGDIYTATELTLLTAVTDKVSAELRRFDEAEIGREVQAMSDALRRYVPDSIAAQIFSGQNLDARECEVSIFSSIFVVIRPMLKTNPPLRSFRR